MSVRGEDVENDRGAIDHRDSQSGLEIALLARGQLVVTRDQVRIGARKLGAQLVDLSRPEVCVRMRAVPSLGELADARHAGCQQQLAQLGEVIFVSVADRRNQVGALAGATAGALSVGRDSGA